MEDVQEQMMGGAGIETGGAGGGDGQGETALQLVKSEERAPPGEEGAEEVRAEPPHSLSVITRRGRTITAAGHITEEELVDDGVKDEPPEAGGADERQEPPPPYAERPEPERHYDEERMRLAEAEAQRYLAFKQEPYRGGGPRRALALRYQHAGDEGGGAYAEGEAARQYEQASAALDMMQGAALDQQAAYQPVKYESRAEGERAGTYASLQPVASGAGGQYAYAPPQQYAAQYSYSGGGKELLALYGGGAGGAGGAGGGERRGEESPPSQLLYRADPTLSSSALAGRGAHLVYGSVVPQSQAVYEAPPSPSSQQVSSADRGRQAPRPPPPRNV